MNIIIKTQNIVDTELKLYTNNAKFKLQITKKIIIKLLNFDMNKQLLVCVLNLACCKSSPIHTDFVIIFL